jgi:lipopolysaccharide export system protein LptC
MNNVKQVIWLFFTLIILAGTGWYYSHSIPLIRLTQDTLANSVETTISRLKVSQFNTEGTLVNLLNTPLMQHIQKDDVYLFQNPHILITQAEQPPWTIRANNAKSFKGSESITFMGNVIVHQEQGNTTQKSTMKTEKVIYYPKDKKASTDLLVTYEQQGNIIQSKGMNAYLDEKRVELLHQARGSYVPTNG